MAKKIDALLKRYEESQKKKERLISEIEDLRREQRNFEDKAEQAAEKGLDDEYIGLKAKADRAGSIAHVRETLLKKTDCISKEEAIEAWKEYIGPENAALEKAIKEYSDARRKLAEKFIQLVNRQIPSFIIREKLDFMTGENLLEGLHVSTANVDQVLKDYPMLTINQMNYGADLRFFNRTMSISAEENESVGFLTYMHRSLK